MFRGRLYATNAESRRGQAYVAEALFAVVLLAGVTLVVTGTLAIDEPALSADDREAQTELEADVHNVLEQSKQEGSLKSNMLNWDDVEERYVGEEDTNKTGTYEDFPDTLFGDRLIEIDQRDDDLGRDVDINVKFVPSKNGSAETPAFGHQRPESHPFIEWSDASNKMVTVDTHVTLYGDDQFQLPPRAHRTEPTQSTVSANTTKLAELDDDDEFPIPPASSYDEVGEDDIYNVVNVRVIVWEI